MSRTFLRGAALVLLLGVIVGVPVVVARLVGFPFPTLAQLRSAWSSHQIDSDLVVHIGISVFLALWAWFACTALAEVWQVVAWRRGEPSSRLAPIPPGASGWARALVRFVAVSAVSTTATLGSIVPVARPAVAQPAPPHAAPAVSASRHSSATRLVASGRDTPYSLATSVGRPELRDRIIELNRGRPAPSGDPWLGGVFPAGMEVVLPEEHAVLTPMGPAHEVVAGDSYWRIADAHLMAAHEREATPREVLEYTESLVAFNQPLLGHRDPTLIVPGELVVFTDASPSPTVPVGDAPVPVAAPLPVEVVPAADDLPVPDVSTPSVVAPGLAPPEAPALAPPAEQRPQPAPPLPGVEAGSSIRPSSALPYAAGLGGALMVSAGAVGLLESRRRRQLRAAGVGMRLQAPTAEQAHTEVLLRSLDASERLARLDVAVRAAAPDLAAQGACVVAALLGDTGEVRLFLRGTAMPSGPEWQVDLHTNTWRMAARTPLSALAPRARTSAQPCPALVHIGGAVEGGELFVDLEAVGTLSVRSPHSTAILRALAASLAVSPFLETARLFTAGLETRLDGDHCEAMDSLDAALDAAAMALGSTASLTRASSTFGLRANGVGDGVWEPAIVVAAGCDEASVLAGVECVAAGGRGLGVVVDVALANNEWQLRLDDDAHHVLEPLGVRVRPVGVSEADVAVVASLLEAAESPPEQEATLVSTDAVSLPPEPFAEADWALMVRVLGPVAVVTRAGVPAECERSKALELIVWLGQHRERPTRTAARTALWDLDVRDATFANVVSDARRAMARATTPAAGEEWIGRTLTEDLPLHHRVVTDAELLAARARHARSLSAPAAVEVLRPGVELLAGMPFAGTSYLWTDAEGVTSSLVLLATGAAIQLANHYLALGDVEGVFWATGQGLKVLTGHEELIALRMRAHARNGDLAGVRGEWESYERAIAADPWAAAEPAPKLVALRRELLTVSRSDAVGA